MLKETFKGKGKNRILVITGVHGNEHTPIEAGRILSNKLKQYDSKTKCFKTVTILHAVNKNGIFANKREMVSKVTTDLNRSFYQPETKLIEVIKTHIEENDTIIDVHSSPNCHEVVLLNQNLKANSYIEFLNDISLPYYLRANDNDTIKKYCNNLNKNAFTIELNKIDDIDIESASKGVSLIEYIIQNINKLQIVESEPSYKESFEFNSYKQGLFKPVVRLGQIIDDGVIIGMMLNLDTMEEEIVRYRGDKAKIIIIVRNPAQKCLLHLTYV